MNLINHYAVFAKLELDILVSCPFCNLFVTSSENRNILGMVDSVNSCSLRIVVKCSEVGIKVSNNYSISTFYVMFRKEKARIDAKTNQEKHKNMSGCPAIREQKCSLRVSE